MCTRWVSAPPALPHWNHLHSYDLPMSPLPRPATRTGPLQGATPPPEPASYQPDGIHRGVERPWLSRKLADSDRASVRAHDVDAYAGIPLLSGHATAARTGEAAERPQ